MSRCRRTRGRVHRKPTKSFAEAIFIPRGGPLTGEESRRPVLQTDSCFLTVITMTLSREAFAAYEEKKKNPDDVQVGFEIRSPSLPSRLSPLEPGRLYLYRVSGETAVPLSCSASKKPSGFERDAKQAAGLGEGECRRGHRVSSQWDCSASGSARGEILGSLFSPTAARRKTKGRASEGGGSRQGSPRKAITRGAGRNGTGRLRKEAVHRA